MVVSSLVLGANTAHSDEVLLIVHLSNVQDPSLELLMEVESQDDKLCLNSSLQPNEH